MDELSTVVNQQGLEQSKVEVLMRSFGDYFSQAKEISQGAKEIIVTQEDQTDLMLQAREKRLQLKNIRVSVDKTRVELKEQSLREGRAIDGLANVIKALIVPVEQHLEKQEKFAEIQQQLRAEAIYSQRLQKLSAYVSDVSLYNLRDMNDDVFDNLLNQSKDAYEQKAELMKKAEEERQAKLKAEAEEQERIRKENERLRKEAEAREQELAKERAEQAKKIELERQARVAAEKKLQAEKEAIEAAKRKEAEEQAAIKKAEEEKRLKALLAPDKEKLETFITTLKAINVPQVESRKVGQCLDKALFDLKKIINELNEFKNTL